LILMSLARLSLYAGPNSCREQAGEL